MSKGKRPRARSFFALGREIRLAARGAENLHVISSFVAYGDTFSVKRRLSRHNKENCSKILVKPLIIWYNLYK